MDSTIASVEAALIGLGKNLEKTFPKEGHPYIEPILILIQTNLEMCGILKVLGGGVSVELAHEVRNLLGSTDAFKSQVSAEVTRQLETRLSGEPAPASPQ